MEYEWGTWRRQSSSHKVIVVIKWDTVCSTRSQERACGFRRWPAWAELESTLFARTRAGSSLTSSSTRNNLFKSAGWHTGVEATQIGKKSQTSDGCSGDPCYAVIPGELSCPWPCLQPSTLRGPWKLASCYTRRNSPLCLLLCAPSFPSDHPGLMWEHLIGKA